MPACFLISNEKSALSPVYIISNVVGEGSITGPDKFFGAYGYPRPNKVGDRVKNGGKRLMAFTENLINEKIRQ